ncbi:HAD-IC family P-type ATPase ['Santalum album' aster yellows phytoplasma]|uniref:HAD-IC family P-type ATPase n=1 Tax='Santalum album' aster yellows phytoplasma TaxID=2831467 RepID=A0ABS5LL27_9MOLU|nr:HAD-IC family P-type ATPase ['Santalum album' aster yellows phytoplasma]MBS2993915.1 HAD-IC family P-type ATPase ['Santalum album' aster yellows phytoplasma]
MNESLNNPNIATKQNFTGLTNKQVEQKKTAGQVNVFNYKNSKSIKDILFSNLFNYLNLLILIVALIIIFIEQYEHLFFLVVSLTNVFISVIQEIKAKITLDKVSLLIKNHSQVIRNSQKEKVFASDLVLGDLLFLEAGEQIAADAKVKSGVLEVNESLLTGESKLVIKKENDFLYSGSYVVSGKSYAEIVAVGSDMYIEKVSQEAKKYKKPTTPLMQNLSSLIKTIIIFVTLFAIILAFFAFNKENNKISGFRQNSLLGLCGMMIAMLPLGLFLLTNISLAVGFVRLAKQKTYAQNLFGIEMLAQINTLCLDKTGTITDGTMQVKKVIPYHPKELDFTKLMNSFLSACPTSNSTYNALINKFSPNTFPTSTPYQPSQNLPLSSTRKYSAVEFNNLGTIFLGAPEFILKNNFNIIQKDFETYTKSGYRVLLLAKSPEPCISQITCKNQKLHDIPCIPLALIIIKDTIKKDAVTTIDFFQKNGVCVKVISGDNHVAVSQIAQRVGIIDAYKTISLEGLSDQEVIQIATKYNVFGRTSPQQKKILIQTFKQAGQKVAMTGDGVNDILALKEADLSIAMASGSQATCNIANLVLMDSNFSSMPKVVFEGRRIINNLDKISILFFTKTIIAFMLAVAVILFNFLRRPCYYPLSPLKLQFVMDYWSIGIPSLFLSFEKNNEIISKNFLLNNLKKAFPYASLAFISYVLTFGVRIGFVSTQTPDFKQLETVSNFVILLSTFILFTVLFRISQPLNLAKLLLFVAMLIGFMTASFILDVFEEMFQFDKLEKVLLVLIIILSLVITQISQKPHPTKTTKSKENK